MLRVEYNVGMVVAGMDTVKLPILMESTVVSFP